MTALIKAVLDHFHQKSVLIEEPVMINSTEVGKIIIRNDVFHELKYIGVGIIELLLPILITFILSSFLVVFLFSLVLERIDGQLNFPKPEENKTGRLRHLSVFNIKRLFMRIVESSENLKRLFHKQKHRVTGDRTQTPCCWATWWIRAIINHNANRARYVLSVWWSQYERDNHCEP